MNVELFGLGVIGVIALIVFLCSKPSSKFDPRYEIVFDCRVVLSCSIEPDNAKKHQVVLPGAKRIFKIVKGPPELKCKKQPSRWWMEENSVYGNPESFFLDLAQKGNITITPLGSKKQE